MQCQVRVMQLAAGWQWWADPQAGTPEVGACLPRLESLACLVRGPQVVSAPRAGAGAGGTRTFLPSGGSSS